MCLGAVGVGSPSTRAEWGVSLAQERQLRSQQHTGPWGGMLAVWLGRPLLWVGLGHEKWSHTSRILAPVPMGLASWRPSLETCDPVRASRVEERAFPVLEACSSLNLCKPCEHLLGATQTSPLVGLGPESGRGPPRGRCHLEPVWGATAWYRGVLRLSLRRWVLCPAVGQDSPADRGQPEPREGHAHCCAHGRQHCGDRRAEGTCSASHPRYCLPAPGLRGQVPPGLLECIPG